MYVCAYSPQVAYTEMCSNTVQWSDFEKICIKPITYFAQYISTRKKCENLWKSTPNLKKTRKIEL